MQFGNAAWGFRETPLEQQLDITKRRMGLSILELSVAGHPNDVLQVNATPAHIDKVQKLFADYEVEISCTATGNDFTLPGKSDNLQQLENVRKVIDIAEQLGGRYLRIFAGFAPLEEVTGSRRGVMIDCLKATVDYAAAAGIIPVMETHGGVTALPSGVKHFHSISSHPDTLAEILDDIPELFINFDPANLYAVGISRPEKVYCRFKDKIRYVHLKDFVPTGNGETVYPAACGESDMDWNALLKAMRDFSGPALIEYENTNDVAAGCQRSLKFLKEKSFQPNYAKEEYVV